MKRKIYISQPNYEEQPGKAGPSNSKNSPRMTRPKDTGYIKATSSAIQVRKVVSIEPTTQMTWDIEMECKTNMLLE